MLEIECETASGQRSTNSKQIERAKAEAAAVLVQLDVLKAEQIYIEPLGEMLHRCLSLLKQWVSSATRWRGSRCVEWRRRRRTCDEALKLAK